MHLPLIIEGMAIGFSIAAPIGPVGILCIRRSLKRGRLSGFITGLGTATVDAIYAGIAVFGVSLIGDFLMSYKVFLELFAVLFLVFLGHKILTEKTAPGEVQKLGKKGLISDFLSTFAITMSNPMTIFAMAAIFTGININTRVHGSLSALMIVVGVFLGSAIWWFILSGIVCFIGKRTNKNILSIVNTISGVGLIAFALFLLINLLLS
ncbi:MAG: LysE family transporter [Candidatus Absconditabacteria bacterium]